VKTQFDRWRIAVGRALAIGLMAAAGFVAAGGGLASAEAQSVVRRLSGPALSPPLSELPDAPPTASWQLKITPQPQRLPPRATAFAGLRDADTIQPQQDQPSPAFTAQASFTGIVFNGSLPPDPNIAVGQKYIVEAANGAIAVFDKNGLLISGPKPIYSLWAGSSSTQCSSSAVAASNDAVVQYDNLADGGAGRWLIAEPGVRSPPYSECIAISVTSDPTGAYYLYADTQFGNYFNDYPKLGVWPTATNSAYLASYNLTQNGTTTGSDLCAYDRNAMLGGSSAPAMLCSLISSDGNFLPSDLDGAVPPNAGTPGYFLNIETRSSLRLYQLSPNFMTQTVVLSPPHDIPVVPFTEACVDACVPQPSTTIKLEALGDRLMYRLAYRVFADHAAMVVNHSVIAGLTIGVRWYELRPTGTGTFGVYQYGTFSPNSAYRWMGSMAIDKLGNIAVGYSESSARIYPEIAYAGRTPGMTLGTMGAEAILQAGHGSQTTYTRWGDYTAMRIDPSDDCTFWYTDEYYTTTSTSWSTAIGQFRFNACP
jgi:hypothetical protein